MHLKFKKLNENAQLPVYATDGAAGMDIFACIDSPTVLYSGEAAAIPTGVAMELPHGFEAQFRGRSGLAFKHAIFSFNGTIDSDYRGEIKGLLINHSRVPFIITPGMRIGQMVINAAVVRCYPEFAEELKETKRGGNGFGSTGLEALGAEMDKQFDNELDHLTADGLAKIREKILEDIKKDDADHKAWKKAVGYIPYDEKMGDNHPDQESIQDALLNHSKGIKND